MRVMGQRSGVRVSIKGRCKGSGSVLGVGVSPRGRGQFFGVGVSPRGRSHGLIKFWIFVVFSVFFIYIWNFSYVCYVYVIYTTCYVYVIYTTEDDKIREKLYVRAE